MKNYLYISYYLRSTEKGLRVIIACIYFCYVYSSTSVQRSNITVLGYRCVTTVSFNVTYVV